MRQVHRKGLATVMLTGGALAISGYAHADSNADGGAARSPGLLAGNTVQLPVHVPVNVCGNTVNVVGVLNPAAGNSCANTGQGDGGSQAGHSGTTAEGGAEDSPGGLGGNTVRIPIDIPVNVTGNSVNVVGIGNAAIGNSSSNTPGKPPVRPRPATPPKAVKPHIPAPRPQAPGSDVALARTGAGGVAYTLPAGAAMLLGGVVLYRRCRPTRVSGRRA
ncbi:chaplin [Streptomyces sp. ISL-1]|uniref:chaplin n=1 Tax=Streptomyces sp. ISL-1 TaxID=2817657 RepID=UPI001BE797DB|nr:chaplin [Streptomyces sp. ISL-1]MBT2390455.1 chaplin [Streptomyces sp. ISL-1]